MALQDKLNHISSYTSKLIRRKFGRGPQSCIAALNKNFLVLYIRGFISPMEEVLLQQGQAASVDNARSVIINNLLDELTGVIQYSLDIEVEDHYHDWNFPNNSGVIMITLKKDAHKGKLNTDIVCNELESEVARLSALVQKAPEVINVYPVAENIFLVERSGILIPIEKALIRKGYIKELRITKDELEKSYFHRDGRFERIFNKKVQDIFIDWNLKEDKSMICFILK